MISNNVTAVRASTYTQQSDQSSSFKSGGKPMSSLISIVDLNKKYAGKSVLKNISLELKSGQIFGLLGPNGAGKTTCLQAILGLISFNGSIDVMGHDPRHARVKMLSELAYISDVAILPKWLKVEQCISYMSASHPKFNSKKALAFLAKTNVSLSSKIKTLSKGMITQVHLALMLAIDVKILVLDEPTLGLDLLTRAQFYEHLLEDFYSDQKCILITTHQVEEIEHILTDIAFIQEGELILSDNVHHLQQRYRYVAITADKIAAAKLLNPIYSHSQMGLTAMMFVDINDNKLAELGPVSTPTLAQIFIATLGPAKQTVEEQL